MPIYKNILSLALVELFEKIVDLEVISMKKRLNQLAKGNIFMIIHYDDIQILF